LGKIKEPQEYEFSRPNEPVANTSPGWSNKERADRCDSEYSEARASLRPQSDLWKTDGREVASWIVMASACLCGESAHDLGNDCIHVLSHVDKIGGARACVPCRATTLKMKTTESVMTTTGSTLSPGDSSVYNPVPVGQQSGSFVHAPDLNHVVKVEGKRRTQHCARATASTSSSCAAGSLICRLLCAVSGCFPSHNRGRTARRLRRCRARSRGA